MPGSIAARCGSSSSPSAACARRTPTTSQHYAQAAARDWRGVELVEVREDEQVPRADPRARVRLAARTASGEAMDSVAFARWLEERRQTGRDLCFVIGGPFGTRARPTSTTACRFGPMTLPHQLARVVLLEQLYRAHKILAGRAVPLLTRRLSVPMTSPVERPARPSVDAAAGDARRRQRGASPLERPQAGRPRRLRDERGDAAGQAAGASRRARSPRSSPRAARGARRSRWTRSRSPGPGFLNLFLADAWYADGAGRRARRRATTGGRGAAARASRSTSSSSRANPTGPLHVGHAPQRRLRRRARADPRAFAGHDVEREYYVNDYGTQVQLLGESIAARRAAARIARGRLPGRVRHRAGAARSRAPRPDPDELAGGGRRS